ncbi:MAG TPA: STAS domain-containing protein [Planctomycetota bacterium]|jgi:anti-anti-sigma factor
MAANELTIEREVLTDKGVLVLHLTGYLDAHTFDRFEGSLIDIFEEGHTKIVIDMGHVEYVSSAGTGVLIGAQSVARREGGDVILMGVTPDVREIFDLLGLTHTFQIFDDISAALTAF